MMSLAGALSDERGQLLAADSKGRVGHATARERTAKWLVKEAGGGKARGGGIGAIMGGRARVTMRIVSRVRRTEGNMSIASRAEVVPIVLLAGV